MKRILVLLTVVALMMVGLVGGMASAAFAARDEFGCRVTDNYTVISITPGVSKDHNGDGILCRYINNNGRIQVSDNHL
jgi:hypothetical protein